MVKYIQAWFLMRDIQVILDRMVTYNECLAAVRKAPYELLLRRMPYPELICVSDKDFTDQLVKLVNRHA